MRLMRTVMILGIVSAVAIGMAIAQAPAAGGGQRGAGAGGGRGGGARGPVFSVSSPSFPSGGEIPMKHAFRGENMSPAFEFKWFNGTAAAEQPAGVQSFTIVFHDAENVGPNRGTADTLHWTVYNIPATARGLAEGALPEGTLTGPGIRGGPQGQYFGPGAGQGPFHHYIFEFYALDTKLDFPMPPTREQLMAAMEGHVLGKAAYVGRFRTP